jgi:hypothetical protein
MVQVTGSEIRARFLDADGQSHEETIQSQDIVRVTLERAAGCIHWYLQHQAGWTFHFNDEFGGAEAVIVWLQRSLGFSRPAHIVGPGGKGTVAWLRG